MDEDGQEVDLVHWVSQPLVVEVNVSARGLLHEHEQEQLVV